MNERLRQLGTYPQVALEQQKQDLLRRGVRVFDFGSGETGEAPPAAFLHALHAAAAGPAASPPVGGRPDLCQSIAGWLQRRFAVTVDPAREVLPTLGRKEALFHLPMVLVQVPSDKDLVLYGEPAAPVYEIAALFAEAWTYAVPLAAGNGYCLDPDAVPEAVLRRAAVVFLNSPHDPTGQCLPDGLFRAWVAARDQFGFTLVNDEGCADLWYGAARPRSLLEFGRKGCLSVHSLSRRSMLPGIRSGFLAGDADVLAEYRRFRAAMGTAPADFLQQASAAAWQDDTHAEGRRKALQPQREAMLAHLHGRGLRVHPGTASPYLWAELPAGHTDLAYVARCRENGILLAPGSWFGRGLEQHVRIALGPSAAECAAAFAVWPR